MQTRRPTPFTVVPVALWAAAFVLDLLSFSGGEPFVRAAFVASSIACVVALFVLVGGRNGWNRLPRGHPLVSLGISQAITSLTALAFFCVCLWMRAVAIGATETSPGILIVSGLGLLLVTASAILGHLITREVARGPGAVVVPFPRSRTARPA